MALLFVKDPADLLGDILANLLLHQLTFLVMHQLASAVLLVVTILKGHQLALIFLLALLDGRRADLSGCAGRFHFFANLHLLALLPGDLFADSAARGSADLMIPGLANLGAHVLALAPDDVITLLMIPGDAFLADVWNALFPLLVMTLLNVLYGTFLPSAGLSLAITRIRSGRGRQCQQYRPEDGLNPNFHLFPR